MDETRNETIAVGTGDRLFSRGIDIGDAHDIGIVKTGAELIKVMA